MQPLRSTRVRERLLGPLLEALTPTSALLLAPLLLALLPAALLDVKQTADRLGVSERMVRELVYKRQIPFHKIGKRLLRFDEDDLEAWLLANRTPVRRPLSDIGLGDYS